MIYLIFILFLISILYLISSKQKETYNNKKDYNNCYSYAFNNMSSMYDSKPQPGNISNIKEVEKNNYHCNEFTKRVLKDYGNDVYVLSLDEYKNGKKCDNDYYTIFLAIDNNGRSKDYHFYKQDIENGIWTHKPGLKSISKYDSDGNIITNPLIANRDYEKGSSNKDVYNYSVPCTFFCKKK